MAKQKAAVESSKTSESEATVPSSESQARARSKSASAPLMAAFAVVLLGGAAFGLTRGTRLESSFVTAMNQSGAQVWRNQAGDFVERSGIGDMYGLVRFHAHRSTISRYMGFCETEPVIALNAFRRTLQEGTPSGRMVALYSSFYLANSKSLTPQDWDLLLTRLNPERESDRDTRMVALRAIADLILIKERPSKSALTAVPEGFKDSDEKAVSPDVEVRDFRVDGAKYYQVRWSSPDLAWAWLQVHQKSGKWDEQMQRFVIGAP